MAVALGAVFALLAVLGALGALRGLDQYAVDHWMPGLDHAARPHGGFLGAASVGDALVPGYSVPRHGSAAASLLTYVVVLLASGLAAVLIVAAALAALWRRGRADLALSLAAAFVLADLAEVVTKVLLERPDLHATAAPGELPRRLPFDHSYPSGHALRAALIAACVCAAWPRLRAPLVAWALAVPVLLVTGGWHTPSDVVGGSLLAAGAVALAVAAAPALATRLAPGRSQDGVPEG